MTWVENFFAAAERLQTTALYNFSEEVRRRGYGRAAKIIVDGANGGIFYRWFCEDGLRPKPDDVPVRNTVYLTEDTLLDLITPDVKLDALVALVEKEGSIERALLRLHPRLDIRTAVAHRLFVVDGDTPDIDSELWAQIYEKFLLKIAFPMAVRAMLAKGKKEAM